MKNDVLVKIVFVEQDTEKILKGYIREQDDTSVTVESMYDKSMLYIGKRFIVKIVYLPIQGDF